MIRISTQMANERNLSAMLRQQSEVSDTQLQLSTGRRVLTPADDPASAARVLGLNGAVETLGQYQSNIDLLTSRLETEEGALTGATNLLQRIRELTVQGNNDVLTVTDKAAIASEIRQLRDELFSIANTKDSNGEYVFAGYQSSNRPFSYSAGVYTYSGDSGQRELQIAPGRTVADGDNGFDTFMSVATGPITTVTTIAATTAVPPAILDGEITIDGGNGYGAISIGALPAAVNPTDRATQLRDAINAISDQTGVTAENATATTLTLTAVGGTGITVALSGSATTANTGLTAGTTAPVTSNRSIFETLDLLATELESGNSVTRYITDVQLAMDNLIEVRTSVGGRLNAIEEQTSVNEDLLLALEKHRSEERDLDYAEAITRFESQMVALQASQQAYVKVKGLSLFNYL
ncbi:flagellar hook-associated protein FlgL [Sedimenticola sp.]|uniref:flagellar hook-associated protein FlgL n=1 Tax=Sedimenticola sp. TaxID=1940285 RepID=UPI003D115608